MKYLTFIIILVCIFSACKKENVEPVEMFNVLYAFWVENGYDTDISIFKKANKFDSDKYGFQILECGKFVEWKNSGWCGTPPIVYANYDGKWSKVSNSIISVESPYWGGTMIFKIEIVSLNENELKVRYNYNN